MLSLDLRQVLPPKMPFFVRHKEQFSSKIFPQIPKYDNFIINIVVGITIITINRKCRYRTTILKGHCTLLRQC